MTETTPPAVRKYQRNEDAYADYDWHQQLKPESDGVKFTDETFCGLKGKRGITVPEGISGNRKLLNEIDSDVLRYDLSRETFAEGFTIEELNDIIDYVSWVVFDGIALRAQEGKSGLLPRQEYEFLGLVQSSLRYAEFFKTLVDEIGINGAIDLAGQGRSELGSKITTVTLSAVSNLAHTGAIALETLDCIDSHDPLFVDKRIWNITVSTALLFGCRGEEGHLFAHQNRYTIHGKDDAVVSHVRDHLRALDTSEQGEFRKFCAASELLSFLIHYDSRLGFKDTGPYLTDDGKPMIVREIHVNEPLFPWSKISEDRDLPYCFTVAFTIDPEEVGQKGEQLREIRVDDNGTTFTKPGNYMKAVESAAVFARYETEQADPLSLEDIEVVDLDELSTLADRCNEAIEEWYKMTSALPRRSKIMNGAWVYYGGVLGPFLRGLDKFEEVEGEMDFWEYHPLASEAYYKGMGDWAHEVLPERIFSGEGWTHIPTDDELNNESAYGDYLQDVRSDLGWESDLTGTEDIPDRWRGKMDEHNILTDIPITKFQ